MFQRANPKGESVSHFWAVTCFFNPAGYRRKLANYKTFRKLLAIPLVAVELSHEARFELVEGDAEILVQLSGADVMWQKERLLNIAISHLPPECDFFAWLDCDVIFSREDWVSAAVHELNRTDICHLYRSVYHIARDATTISRDTSVLWYDSLGYAVAMGIMPPVFFKDSVTRIFRRGHAWCARRDVIAPHGSVAKTR